MTKQKDSSKLVHLLSSLGMDTIVDKLKMETLNGDHSPQECLDHSKFKLTPPSPELECKECGVKFQVKQAVEFFFHERDCKTKTAMARHRSAQTQIPMPLPPSNLSPHSLVESSIGPDMEIYEEFEEGKKTDPTSGDSLDCSQLVVSAGMKVSKKCYICGTVIAGTGKYWIHSLYSHFSRRHFAEELFRDFGTPDMKCPKCGKEKEQKSGFLTHIGSYHRLVENYLDMNKLNGQETFSNNKGRARSQSKSEGKFSCPFCEEKLVIRPVLLSHLLSKHFKKDCEEAIKQILEKSGGVCPKCPGFSWSQPGALNWTTLTHFSRKHKIAEDLEYSDNLLNQGNSPS